MSRFVLRYRGKSRAPSRDVRRVRSAGAIRILEATERMFLVEAEEQDLNEVMKELPDWLVVPERTYPLPDPRPRVRTP